MGWKDSAVHVVLVRRQSTSRPAVAVVEVAAVAGGRIALRCYYLHSTQISLPSPLRHTHNRGQTTQGCCQQDCSQRSRQRNRKHTSRRHAYPLSSCHCSFVRLWSGRRSQNSLSSLYLSLNSQFSRRFLLCSLRDYRLSSRIHPVVLYHCLSSLYPRRSHTPYRPLCLSLYRYRLACLCRVLFDSCV